MCSSLSSINPCRGKMSHRNQLDSLSQSSNWARSLPVRTTDTECSLQVSFLCVYTFFYGVQVQCVWDPPSVVWGPVRQAGTWEAWRRRAAGRICWWTLLPPNQRERACRGRYMPRASQPAENNNNNNMSDNKLNFFSVNLNNRFLTSEPQLWSLPAAFFFVLRVENFNVKAEWVEVP